MNKIVNTIIDVITNNLGYPVELDENSILKDINMDSLDYSVLAAILENKFKIRIKLEEYKELNTINNLAQYIYDKCNS